MSFSGGPAGKDWSPPDDPLNAFCRANHAALPPIASGALDGLDFVAKDVMDIEGSTTGFGQPDWLRSHQPAEAHAGSVERLLRAGARLVGRTICDELTYSLSGENVHYGTPVNTKAPDRIPGGSSSGSVAAVAGGLVDVALGTDCAGSVRLPASYCGVFGMRPSHGRIAATGIIPFAPSFDTVGWFARDPALLERVGDVLLDGPDDPEQPRRLLIAEDAFDLVDRSVVEALAPAVDIVRGPFAEIADVAVCPTDLNDWRECFSLIQGAEIWANLGAWIDARQPKLGPGIKDRIAFARKITPDQARAARQGRQHIIEQLQIIIQPGTVLCVPSAPRAAPLKGTATSTIEVTYRHQAICLLCIAGLGGLPQISLPMATIDGYPLGLSLIGPVGSDRHLLKFARTLF